jgi:predicted membrane-bound mannosyltransferase
LTPTTPSSQSQLARVIFALLAVFLTILGLIILSLVPNGIELGLLISLTGSGLLILWSRRDPSPRFVRWVERLRLTPRRIMFGLGIGCSALTVFTNYLLARQDRYDYSLTWLFWIASMLCLLASCAVRPTGSVRDWLKAHRTELIGIGLVTLLGLALRMYLLGQLPRVIDGDEGLHGVFALTTSRGNLSNPFSLFANIGSIYLHAINLSLSMFGQTPFALRLLPALIGSLAVPATYLLARQLFNQRIALFSALLLAVSHAHLHFSRIASVPYIAATFFVPLELFLFSRALMRRSSFSAALGGIVLAIHFSVYLTAQVVIAFLVIFLVILVVTRQPVIRQSWRQVLLFASCAVIIALPQLAYNASNPDQFLARLNADGVFQSGWLASEMAVTGHSSVQILTDRVTHVFLALIVYPIIDFYNTPLPVLPTITAGLFLIGLVLALVRTRDWRYLLLNGYFWSLLITIGLFAIPASADAYRMLAALPAIMILAALGLDQILISLQLDLPSRRGVRVGLLIPLFVAMLLLTTHAYFDDFAGRCQFGGDLGTRFASYFGNYLRQLDRETTVYLLSSQEARYGVHRSVDFLSKGMPVTNVEGPVSDIVKDPNTVVVTSPARADELRAWARANPGGSLHYEYDCDKLILVAYHLP